MEITIRGRCPEDFPDVRMFNSRLAGELARSVRQRLELRPNDRVTIEIIMEEKLVPDQG